MRSPEPPPNHEQALRVAPLAVEAGQLGPFRIAGIWQLSSRNDLFGSYSALVEPAPGRLLALSTFAGATALAMQSPLPAAALRAQVTSNAETGEINQLCALESRDDFVTSINWAEMVSPSHGLLVWACSHG